MIYWFIGQPECGKTTLAKMFKQRAFTTTMYFDGDDLRKIFGNSYSPEHFTRKWREDQTRILQGLVAYIADQGFDVVVATVNPYRNIREEFKQARKDIREIYVHKTDVRSRDKFKAQDYEEPLENFISINTTGSTPEQSLQQIFDALRHA